MSITVIQIHIGFSRGLYHKNVPIKLHGIMANIFVHGVITQHVTMEAIECILVTITQSVVKLLSVPA